LSILTQDEFEFGTLNDSEVTITEREASPNFD